ncbi:MAG: hypothetical protein ACFFCX_08240 [Candidatus Sifarchaeia archaeon]
MSGYVWTRVLAPIIVGFGVTFLFIFILFETFGISEYVWPILFPIFTGTFGIIILLSFIIGIISNKGCKVPTDQEMVQHKLVPKYPTHESASTDYPSYDIGTAGAAYIIPLYCPHCMNKLELNRVEWIGAHELTCPSCFSVVQVGVQENF